MSRAPERVRWPLRIEVQRHPMTGALAGALLMISGVLLLFALGVIPMSPWWLLVCTPAGAVLGGVLAYSAPARRVR